MCLNTWFYHLHDNWGRNGMERCGIFRQIIPALFNLHMVTRVYFFLGYCVGMVYVCIYISLETIVRFTSVVYVHVI